MSNEASRKAFETWAKAAVLDTALWWTGPDTYKSNTTNGAWDAWQASRKALEAEQAQAVEPAGYVGCDDRCGSLNIGTLGLLTHALPTGTPLYLHSTSPSAEPPVKQTLSTERVELIAEFRRDARVDSLFGDDVRKHRSNRAVMQQALDALQALWLLGDKAGAIANPAIDSLKVAIAQPTTNPLKNAEIDALGVSGIEKFPTMFTRVPWGSELMLYARQLARAIEAHHDIPPPRRQEMTDTSRKAFEAWCGTVNEKDNSPSNRRDWKVWQASREALEAEQAQEPSLAEILMTKGVKMETQLVEKQRDHIVAITNMVASEQAQTGEPIQRSKTIAKSKWVNDLWMKAVFENYDEREAQQVAVPVNKRNPMTECEILHADPCPHEMFDQQRIAFARAIEAHHGITPQGDKP